jgi:hypothetical protein
MNFRLYDILSQIIPGFLVFLSYNDLTGKEWDNNFALPATIISFIIGYFINTLSSWLEGFFYWTWKGKPSSRLIDGHDINKVRFYSANQVKELLKAETEKQNPTNDEIFSIAMRYANSDRFPRVQAFNESYAFSRVILTTLIFSFFLLSFRYYSSLYFWIIFSVLIVVSWQRCKERAYYYAKEVLQSYLSEKNNK